MAKGGKAAAPAPAAAGGAGGGFTLISARRVESAKGRAWGWVPVQVALLVLAVGIAYTIRLYAIEEYGLVIHEFDPWFNYRATEVSRVVWCCCLCGGGLSR
jgi:hypothetical protein